MCVGRDSQLPQLCSQPTAINITLIQYYYVSVIYLKVTNFYRYICLRFLSFTSSKCCYSTPFNDIHDDFLIFTGIKFCGLGYNSEKSKN